MYHPDPHAPSHHVHASTNGRAPPPPHHQQQPPSTAYSSFASSSSRPYGSQPSPSYSTDGYPSYGQPQYQQHFQPPPIPPTPPPQHLTGAYPHHSRYLKIHTFTPSSSHPSSSHVDLHVQCTLFPSAKNNPDTSHPPAKTIRLCFGSLPLATKVARSPGSATAAPEGQELLLSCRVPKWEDVMASGKSGLGGGRVGVHCEILGAGQGNEEERVLERVWFGEFEFLGMVGEQTQPGMDVGGWGGQGRVHTQLPVSQKRPGSPLLGHSPQRRQSPGFRHDIDPYYAQQEFNVVDSTNSSPYLQVDLQRVPSATGSYSYHNELNPNQESSRQYPASPLTVHSSVPSSSQACLSPQPGHGSPQFWTAPAVPSQTRPHGPPPPIIPPSPSHPLTINPQNLSPTTPPNPQSQGPPSDSTPLMVRTFQLPRTPKAQRATPASAGVKESPGMVTRAVDGRDTAQSGTSRGGTTKASLLLQGDLGQMAIGWNQDEWASRRRLIQFWRRHEKGTIHAAFRPIAQSDYIENSIVISCIYREDTNECYVTSVDTIYLLEALIGVRFSVEEKNRIRRNLEGLKPDTVSKNKSSTEEFFKLIMGLPKPKPRNIEKDVKVFKWANFGDALVKIISKYSVAYEEPRGPPSPRIPGPLQSLPSGSSEPPVPSPIFQYPPPAHQPSPHPQDPNFQHGPYSYGAPQQEQFSNQPYVADSSSLGSMEFPPSASSSTSSLLTAPYNSRRVGGVGSAPPPAGQAGSSPFTTSTLHHASSASPVPYNSVNGGISQGSSSSTGLLPAFHQPQLNDTVAFDFTDYFNPSENNTPSSTAPPYPGSTSTSNSTTAAFASPAVPTPSSLSEFHPTSSAPFHPASSSSFPVLQSFELEPKHVSPLATLPLGVESLALSGKDAAAASGRGVRMDEVLMKPPTLAEDVATPMDEDDDDDHAGGDESDDDTAGLAP